MMSDMSLEPTSLFLDLVISAVGLALFVYGKKQQRGPHLGAGLVLMVYPYFVTGALPLLATAVAVCVALWLAVRMGW
jgi:hypothetical protein